MAVAGIDQTAVALVDNCLHDHRQLASQAQAAGLRCDLAPTGEAALRLAQLCRPGLWLVSYALPDMCGLELCRLLQPRLAGARVFVFADRYDSQVEIAALSAGVPFVCKPIPGMVLEPLLTVALDRSPVMPFDACQLAPAAQLAG